MSDEFDPAKIEVISEIATNAAGDPVPLDDPGVVAIEVHWRDKSTGEVLRTYLVQEGDTPTR